MKPLPPAPQTLEDYIVWKALQMDNGADPMWFALREYSIDADRRDAYVMLFLESAKANGCHSTLTRAGQLYGFIGSFVRLPAVPPQDEDYA